MKTLEVTSNESIATEDNLISVENRVDEAKGTHKKYFLAIKLISPILIILIGIVVLKITGLYDGMNSTAGKFVLCVVISYSYLIAFRRGLYSR